jgi:hypothetical protein
MRRGQPFGSECWQAEVAARLGVESSLRPRGRPRKQPNNGSSPLSPLTPFSPRVAFLLFPLRQDSVPDSETPQNSKELQHNCKNRLFRPSAGQLRVAACVHRKWIALGLSPGEEHHGTND